MQPRINANDANLKTAGGNGKAWPSGNPESLRYSF
jgi:hypothetical protein